MPVKAPIGSPLKLGPNSTSGELDGSGFENPRLFLTVTPSGPMALPWTFEVRYAGGQWIQVASGTTASQVFQAFPIPHPGTAWSNAPNVGGSVRLNNTDAAQTVEACLIVYEAQNTVA